MPGPNKIRSISVERLVDTNMHTNMDINWEQDQVAKAHATREHASRVADRERDTRAAAAALGSSAPGRSSTSSSVPYRRAPGEAKPPPPMPKSTAASSGHASLPPPVAAGQILPVPMGPRAKAGPPASAASSDPVVANSAPGSSPRVLLTLAKAGQDHCRESAGRTSGAYSHQPQWRRPW